MSRLPWPVNWNEITYLLKSGWYDFTGTDFSQTRYTDINLALYAGAVIACTLLLKWLLPKLLFYLFGRNRTEDSQKVSGHLISGRGFIAKIFFSLPKFALVIPLTAVLFAIANPFLPVTRDEKKYVETRVRVDIRDVSGSMGFLLGDTNTNKSRAEIAHNAHLEFLRMRAGKGDRTSFWVFSNNPYLIQSFTVDEEVYYQQVYDAPWELGSTAPDDFGPERWANYPIPKSRYTFAIDEGGTMMFPALRAVANQFEEDDKKQKSSPFYRVVGRSVLILTDSDISDFEQAKYYVDELRKKRVVIYVILIGPNAPTVDEEGNAYTTVSPILEEIKRNGGKYFPVSSQDSILNAYREVDKLEKTKIQIEKKVFKIPLFYKFVFISISVLIIIIPLGLFLKLFEHP